MMRLGKFLVINRRTYAVLRKKKNENEIEIIRFFYIFG
jgi:hypothetical protein